MFLQSTKTLETFDHLFDKGNALIENRLMRVMERLKNHGRKENNLHFLKSLNV